MLCYLFKYLIRAPVDRASYVKKQSFRELSIGMGGGGRGLDTNVLFPTTK
jgi:hypothetical protein